MPRSISGTHFVTFYFKIQLDEAIDSADDGDLCITWLDGVESVVDVDERLSIFKAGLDYSSWIFDIALQSRRPQ